jgi:hypothetical protein
MGGTYYAIGISGRRTFGVGRGAHNCFILAVMLTVRSPGTSASTFPDFKTNGADQARGSVLDGNGSRLHRR